MKIIKESDEGIELKKETKNIIGCGNHYIMIANHPNEKYQYSWLDFLTFPKGFRLKNKPVISVEKSEYKKAKHAFRICFESKDDIDEVIRILNILKDKHDIDTSKEEGFNE